MALNRAALLQAADPRRWALWRQRWWLVGYLLLVYAAAAIFPVVSGDTIAAGSWWRLLALGALGVSVTELSRQTERVRRMLSSSSTSHIDLTSVWTVAGALLLPLQLLPLLVAILYTHLGLRSWRRISGAVPYRVVGTAAIALVNCYVVRLVLVAGGWRIGGGATGDGHEALSGPVTITGSLLLLAALVAHFITGMVMVAPALLARGESPHSVFSNWLDDALEFATEVIGVITAAIFVNLPLFAPVFVPVLLLMQRSSLAADLEAPAVTDAKTGLHNLDAWTRLAEAALAQAEREGTPVSVLLIDLDRFKSVNDTHGHLVGDLALRAVARALDLAVRPYDITGRFGGEEFVALLPTTSSTAAVAVAERLRTSVERLNVRAPGEQTLTDLSVSIGVSTSLPEHAGLPALLAAADIALYAAKDNGRNRVETAGVKPIRESSVINQVSIRR